MRGVELGVVGGRNARGIIQQHRNFVVFRDGQFSLQFFTQIGGVDHRGVFVDGIGEFFAANMREPVWRRSAEWRCQRRSGRRP